MQNLPGVYKIESEGDLNEPGENLLLAKVFSFLRLDFGAKIAAFAVRHNDAQLLVAVVEKAVFVGNNVWMLKTLKQPDLLFSYFYLEMRSMWRVDGDGMNLNR